MKELTGKMLFLNQASGAGISCPWANLKLNPSVPVRSSSENKPWARFGNSTLTADSSAVGCQQLLNESVAKVEIGSNLPELDLMTWSVT